MDLIGCGNDENESTPWFEFRQGSKKSIHSLCPIDFFFKRSFTWRFGWCVYNAMIALLATLLPASEWFVGGHGAESREAATSRLPLRPRSLESRRRRQNRLRSCCQECHQMLRSLTCTKLWARIGCVKRVNQFPPKNKINGEGDEIGWDFRAREQDGKKARKIREKFREMRAKKKRIRRQQWTSPGGQ